LNFKIKLNKIDVRLELFFNKPKIFIPIIILSSILVRLYYAPFELPVASDAIVYFSYAMDITTLRNFPNYLISNDGWAILLSFFFMILPSQEFIDYMIVQRLLSITLSSLTVIPVYLLCRKFFGVNYSLIGVIFFTFEPRLIQNSLLGITEPLYILFGSSSIVLLLHIKKKYNVLSFFIIGLLSIVKIEGVFLFFAISLMFFIKNKLKLKTIKVYLVGISIFLSTLGLMILIRINVSGRDYSSDRIQYSTKDLIQSSIADEGSSFIIDGLINLIKFLGWDLIPIFILFVPIGFIILIKNRNVNKIIILIPIIVMMFPAFYAYAAKAFDTRYLFILYPFFSILSLYTIELFLKKSKKKNLIFTIIIFSLLITSISFIEYKKIDIEHEREALKLSYEVIKRTEIFNEYYPESQYVIIPELSNLGKFPTLTSGIFDKFNGRPNNENNLQDYLEVGYINGLTHLIVDNKEYPEYRMKFFKDIFENEENYPYLTKIFDSKDFGYDYKLKIFEINYEEFDKYFSNKVK
jgi:hypothetical protein